MGDLTVAAIPYYFAGMGLEAWSHERRRARTGPTAGDYEARDTAASLAMGVASLVAPLVARPLFQRFDVFRGRTGRVLLGVAGAAAAHATTPRGPCRRSSTGWRRRSGHPSFGPPVGRVR
jgi:hypothetical protein